MVCDLEACGQGMLPRRVGTQMSRQDTSMEARVGNHDFVVSSPPMLLLLGRTLHVVTFGCCVRAQYIYIYVYHSTRNAKVSKGITGFPDNCLHFLVATNTLYYLPRPPLAGQTAQEDLQMISASSPIICGSCWYRLRQVLYGTPIMVRFFIVEAS